jgi:methanol dehydrogenase (cytochrome c) subunit 2
MKLKTIAVACSALMMMSGASAVMAYDGTKCKAPGDCWEAKPGFPDKIKGSKYDPKHSEKELNKQDTALKAMEKRNAERVEQFKKTGKWVY